MLPARYGCELFVYGCLGTALSQIDTTALELPEVRDVSELRQSLENFCSAAGYRYFTYISGRVVAGRRVTNLDPRERPFRLTNLPEDWQGEYSEKRYYDHDPVMLFALYNLLPDRWTNIIRRNELSTRQQKIVTDAADSGMRDGLIVPVHGPGGEFAVLSLSHNETPAQAKNNVESDDALVHLFALRFHSLARTVLEPVEPEAPVDLTSREIDVLFWTAEGKSSWDISQILSISEATVNFHIKSAKEKLGVYNKTHAVAKMFAFKDRGII